MYLIRTAGVSWGLGPPALGRGSTSGHEHTLRLAARVSSRGDNSATPELVIGGYYRALPSRDLGSCPRKGLPKVRHLNLQTEASYTI